MIYVTSDLHGCPLEWLQDLLQKVGFSQEDDLFVLGDVIDRGDYGITLLRWMAEQPNVHLLLGNHEAMMLSCSFLFEEITEDSLAALDMDKMDIYRNWMENGGEQTLAELKPLMKEQPDVLEGIWDLLRDAPLYETLELNGRRFLLVHAGLENFRADRPLDDYAPGELLWARPGPDVRYFDDMQTIFGHTPTALFGPQYRGRAVKTDTWICIDTGVTAGYRPMLLRLDDMAEFYGA